MELQVSSFPDRTQNSEEKQDSQLPSEENPLLAKSDEADLLNDRTPTGDMGPEDSIIKRGSTKDEASY